MAAPNDARFRSTAGQYQGTPETEVSQIYPLRLFLPFGEFLGATGHEMICLSSITLPVLIMGHVKDRPHGGNEIEGGEGDQQHDMEGGEQQATCIEVVRGEVR
ncbi:hypothetical protein BKA70DRAFT_1216281 [Coprinopsis sp. MPI-PUGE-AT-0042]|nr:hypothetical protein BKA70DRAFT_1216281 [Coprinopsis sp. MPI-PUGE-AT-0042]